MSHVIRKVLLIFSVFAIGLSMWLSHLYFIGIGCSLIAFFIYTLKNATGLKYNQDKVFVILSFVLYIISLVFSLKSSVIIALFTSYELFVAKSIRHTAKQLLPFYLAIVLMFIGKRIIL